MSDQPWIVEARKHIGLSEISGPRHNSTILGWLDHLRAWWKDDETPWCGVFVAHCLKKAGYGLSLPKFWMRARDWMRWGYSIPRPIEGCVVVFERQGGGHVGFVLGVDKYGNLMVLGGNQANRVSISPFSHERVLGYRWCIYQPIPTDKKLPVLMSNGALSTNEA